MAVLNPYVWLFVVRMKHTVAKRKAKVLVLYATVSGTAKRFAHQVSWLQASTWLHRQAFTACAHCVRKPAGSTGRSARQLVLLSANMASMALLERWWTATHKVLRRFQHSDGRNSWNAVDRLYTSAAACMSLSAQLGVVAPHEQRLCRKTVGFTCLSVCRRALQPYVLKPGTR